MSRRRDLLEGVGWPVSQIAAALRALADRSGIGLADDAQPTEEVPTGPEGVRTLGLRMGLELVSVQSSWRGAPAMLATGPMLSRTYDGRLFAFLPARPGRARLLTPDLRVVERPVGVVRDAMRGPIVAAAAAAVEKDLDVLQVAEKRRGRARELLLDQRLGQEAAVTGWVMRPSGPRPLLAQVREAGLFSALRLLVGAVVVQYGLGALAWLLLAWGALSGRVDGGWLVAWALALVTGQVALRGVVLYATGEVALRGGAMVKRLLLLGALRGDLDQMRAQGVGGLIGRAIESEAFESLALNGGMRIVMGAWELVIALGIAAQGAGGGGLVMLGLASLGAAIFVGLAYVRGKDAWTRSRLAMTGELIERMVGHRTRLAQESPADWHRGEDAALADYVERARIPDELEAWLGVWPQRGYMALGILIVALAAGSDPEPLSVALGLAGVLLGGQALGNTAGGVAAIAGAIVARRVVKDLVLSSRRPERVGVVLPETPPAVASPSAVATPGSTPASPTPAAPVLELSRVGFAYPGRARAVLEDIDLALIPGERVLLEGGSGSGKSTLAALMAGLRLPSRGLVLLRGLDPSTWGETAWRRRAVAAPQFHDNRVIAGTFAFNLLLGRGGVPERESLIEAEALCRELGLGPLLERMPAGLMQQVGESGWQLSHGERSRLYLARALLQDADVVLLDESFGALDPENQGRALECALRRAKTLVVIAHP